MDKEYRQMYADIRPNDLLIAEVKKKMAQEPERKKASCRKISLWCGSAAAVIAVVTMTVTTLWNSGHPIDTGKNTGVISGVDDSSQQSVPESELASNPVTERDPSIPEWYQPGRLNVLALLSNKKTTGVSAKTKNDLIQPLGGRFTAASTVPLAAEKDSVLMLPEGYQQQDNAFVGDSFIWMYTEKQQDAHYGCRGVYYDIRQNTTLCLLHQSKQTLSKAGVLTKNSGVTTLMENPFNGNCLVNIKDNMKKTSVVYACNADGSVEKMNLPLRISSEIGVAVNSEHSYGALAISREDDSAYFRVWAVDLNGQKITVKQISIINGTDYRTGEDLRFTPNDRYLIYNIAAENGGLYHFNAREQWFAYDTRTGTLARGNGKFLRYIQNGNVAVMETVSGGKVTDLSTGKDLTHSTGLQNWEKMQVIGMSFSSAKYGYVNEISLENVFDSKQKNVVIRKAVNAYLEKDGYVYSYLHGDKNVECYSIRTGEKFTVPVSKKMLDEIASYGKNVYFDYRMQLNKEGTEILLSYSAYGTTFPIDSAADGQVIAFRDANCLVDMADFVQNNFDGSGSMESNSVSSSVSEYIAGESFYGYSSNSCSGGNVPSDTSHEISEPVGSQNETSSGLHSRAPRPGENISMLLPKQSLGKKANLMVGNGYSALVLYIGDNTIEVFVEDYRDRTFTYYRYWESLNGVFSIYDDASLPASIQFRKPLSAGANQQATKKQYSNLSLAEPMYDYATLYINGKLDNDKVNRAVFNRMIEKRLITQFSIGAYTENGEGRGANEYEDKTVVYNILRVLTKHNQYPGKGDMKDFHLFWDPKKLKGSDLRYWIPFSIGDYSRDMILGRDSNQKPFVCYADAYYYYISEQEYADLSSQCKEAAGQAKQKYDAMAGVQ